MRLHKLREHTRNALSLTPLFTIILGIIAAIFSSYTMGNKVALDTQSNIQTAVQNEKTERIDHETGFVTRDEFSRLFYSEMQKVHSEIDDLRVLIEKHHQ